MKRTYIKTTSQPATMRKIQRLIVKELSLAHPKIYEKLRLEAQKIVDLDNEDVFSDIMVLGLDKPHVKSDKLIEMQKELVLKRRALIKKG